MTESEIGEVDLLIADKYRFEVLIFRQLQLVRAWLHPNALGPIP